MSGSKKGSGWRVRLSTRREPAIAVRLGRSDRVMFCMRVLYSVCILSSNAFFALVIARPFLCCEGNGIYLE